MTARENKTSSWIEIVENVEKLLFYASLLLIPMSILPFPWDLTEYSMGMVLAFFAVVITSIELVKLIWKGRLLVPKGIIDIGVLAVAISIVLSTIFSTSPSTSLFGFDFRFGSGAVAFISLLIYLYSVRSFLFTTEDIVNGAKFLIVGTFITAVFSIFSFYGMNLLAFSPSFDSLFTTGLPLYSSARVAQIVWGVSLILSTFLAAHHFDSKKLPFSFFAILSALVHMFAMFVFSFAQGWEIFLLVLVVLLAMAIWVLVKQRHKPNKGFKIILIVLISLASFFFILSRIPGVASALSNKENKIITQLTISTDTSLKVATQSLSKSVLGSFLGMGQDTFSIAYNQFRPLDNQTLIINATNFTNANNHLFNILTNRGLIGILAWVILGYFIFKTVYKDIKKNVVQKEAELFHLIFDGLVVLLYLASIFIYFPFIVTFLLIYSISMSISLKNMQNKDNLEVYVINWGVFSHSVENSNTRNMTLGISALILALGVFGLISVGRLAGSAYYTLKAETIAAQGRDKINSGLLSEYEKEQMLVAVANNYARGISMNPKSDVLHRRASLVVSQYLEHLAQKYNKTDVEEDKKNLFEQIAIYVEISVEEAKKATELAPKVYANWGARGTVYSKLVGLGLNSYTKSALSSLQSAAQLNPLNYEVYYNAAQLYILNNETDTALRTLNQLFSINPNHIPSLILAGEISLKDKDMKQAERFFSDAKRVMDETSSTANDVYDYVTKKLQDISSSGSAPIQQDIQEEETEQNG